jgi:CRISPR/Cas system-associated endonuclease Cas1
MDISRYNLIIHLEGLRIKKKKKKKKNLRIISVTQIFQLGTSGIVIGLANLLGTRKINTLFW